MSAASSRTPTCRACNRRRPRHRRRPDSRRQPAPTVADKTYDTVWQQAVGKETLRLKYYGPAHTSGDSVVTFVQANVAHMGDLMFNKRHPFIDRPSGASIRNWIVVLESTVKDHAKDTIYIFGHAKDGQPVTGDQSHLLEMRNYLTAVLDVTRKAIADGKSREETMALGPLPKFEDYMEAPPRLTLATVLGIAYDETESWLIRERDDLLTRYMLGLDTTVERIDSAQYNVSSPKEARDLSVDPPGQPRLGWALREQRRRLKRLCAS